MIRRIVLGLLPALLSLALLSGVPAVGASDTQATARTSHSGQPVFKGNLRHETPGTLPSQRADGDDTPDPALRPAGAVDWMIAPSPARAAGACESVPRSHRACAAPPRGPPAA